MNVLRSLCSASLLLVWVSANARIPVKVETFPLNDVRLTQSPFKHAEDLDVRYLLGLDPDRLLAPYLKGAGLEPKADNYTNWENTGLDGHIGGHYVSALSYMYGRHRRRRNQTEVGLHVVRIETCPRRCR